MTIHESMRDWVFCCRFSRGLVLMTLFFSPSVPSTSGKSPALWTPAFGVVFCACLLSGN